MGALSANDWTDYVLEQFEDFTDRLHQVDYRRLITLILYQKRT